MEPFYMPIQLAPSALNQPILPNWSFNLFNIDLGASSDPGMERQVLTKVGSYGKQIGHLAEALEIVILRLKLLDDKALTEKERDALKIFVSDVAEVRKLKRQKD